MFDRQSTQITYIHCDILIRLIRIFNIDMFKNENVPVKSHRSF